MKSYSTLYVFRDFNLTAIAVVGVPRVHCNNPDYSMQRYGRVTHIDPRGFTVECETDMSGGLALQETAKDFSEPPPRIEMTTLRRRSWVLRSLTGAWRVKGGGPTRTYRTKALASREANRRGIDTTVYTNLVVESIDWGSSDRVHLKLCGRSS